jgi:Flp pilus assembly protein TadD
VDLSLSQPVRLLSGFFRPFASRGFSPGVLALAMLLGGCASRGGYLNHVQPDLAAEPAAPSEKSSKPMYLDLIRQMQQQGAYYASLANIDAYRQRYGSSPPLRRLQADALRNTGQADEAKALYQALVHTDQAAAAWHGLGIIAADQQQNPAAEESLSRAVQMDPVNVDYLGDLGYQRLRAGAVASAHEPLAKAAELAPGNVKAVSNLVLWMLLDNDYVQADATMQQANLPEAARQQVRTLAAQLLSTPPAHATVIASLSIHRPTAAAASAAAPSTNQPSEGPVDGVPPSMLERFGTPSTNSEAHP